MEASTPVDFSIAVTLSRPSASTWKVTRICAPPAAAPGYAQRKARQRTAILDQLTLALHHVNGHRRLAIFEGGKLLRAGHRNGGITRDHFLHQAAMVSRPNDSGITSSSSSSLSGLLPTRISAWIAAPMATTLSGSMEVSGVRPKTRQRAHAPAARGSNRRPSPLPALLALQRQRLLAPRRQAIRVRFTSGAIRSLNWAAGDIALPAADLDVRCLGIAQAIFAAMAASSSSRCRRLSLRSLKPVCSRR
ncbi:NAD-specific glutamate dehydrogenase [Klebsiella pneumoniae]|uniref:NAD-specific glutamate dehydrogenase n=1 Tax=Klebsiella pneumoniae TaxID=573 RepID=A0A2X1SDC7_KLEPN|nr:NAD-specific glutamate dehydrogenase [Klebsiella pneumoniae]